MRRIELKTGKSYRLPNSDELVLGAGGEGRYFFYRASVWCCKVWTISLPIAFEVDRDGTVKTGDGQPTPWSVNDLVELSPASREKIANA